MDHLKRKLNERIQRHADGTIERWRDCPRFAYHRVSDRGRVKTCQHVILCPYKDQPPRKRTIKGKILRQHTDSRGRKTINIHCKPCKVHQLVLESFVGPCPQGMECCHGDGNPMNNQLSNLRWDTHVNNCKDRDRHGRTARGSKAGGAKLTEEIAVEIHRLYATGDYSQSQLAKMFKVAYPSVGAILNGESYKHLGLKPILGNHRRGHSPRSRGVKHGNAKLTVQAIKHIRSIYDAGSPEPAEVRRLSALYGVHEETIRVCGKRIRYKDVR